MATVEPQREEKAASNGKKALELTPEEEIVELKQQVGEVKDKYLRLFAEFENYRKRIIRERLDLINMAAQDTMSALLPVLDDFDRAKKSADAPDTEEIFSEGVELLYHKLYNILKLRGLEPMEPMGEEFDSELHEAITEIPCTN